ncbi:unnamed protein product [Linum trigynum]|uniref:C2H2-type domain-containing protein n=1 Tax=Linum trigynum TaxID=586398 RepID=A0AAV2G3S6_9ROSI
MAAENANSTADAVNNGNSADAAAKKAGAAAPQVVFRCAACPREFDNAWDRAMHERDDHHQGYYDSDVWCNICGEIFSDLSGVIAHQHHCHLAEASLLCPCQRRFRRFEDAAQHMIRRHS